MRRHLKQEKFKIKRKMSYSNDFRVKAVLLLLLMTSCSSVKIYNTVQETTGFKMWDFGGSTVIDFASIPWDNFGSFALIIQNGGVSSLQVRGYHIGFSPYDYEVDFNYLGGSFDPTKAIKIEHNQKPSAEKLRVVERIGGITTIYDIPTMTVGDPPNNASFDATDGVVINNCIIAGYALYGNGLDFGCYPSPSAASATTDMYVYND